MNPMQPISSDHPQTGDPAVACSDLVRNLLKEALQYVALVGASDWDPRVTANARNLMVRITSRPEMAIMDRFMWEEGGSSPVQAGGTPQESPIPNSELSSGGPLRNRNKQSRLPAVC
jgi:hypothetical protein